MRIKNSTILFIGLLLLVLGIYVGSSEYFKQKKEKAFTDMNLLLYEKEMPEEKEDPIDIPVDPENPVETPPQYVQRNYDFIAELTIPKIGLTRGLVSMDSPYNDVDHNITIIGGSEMPNVDKSNLILASHSGSCYYCYFNQLYRVEMGDEASITYNNTKYTYKVTDIYNVSKNGQVTIRRNKNKTILTLITCTKNSKTEQTVYILELVNTEKY